MADEFVPWTDSKFMCVGCNCPLPHSERSPDSPRCHGCEEKRAASVEKRVMNTALSRTAAVLARLDNADTRKIKAGVAAAAFAERVGGMDRIGQMMADTFQEALDDPLTPKKEKRQWFVNVMELLQRQEKLDAESSKSLADYGEDELYALLRPLAVELLKESPEFLRQCLSQIGLTVVDATAKTIGQEQG
jgi:hypothetical protein